MLPDSERKGRLIAVRLTEDEFQALSRISEREDLPISRYVREGIALVLKKHSKQ